MLLQDTGVFVVGMREDSHAYSTRNIKQQSRHRHDYCNYCNYCNYPYSYSNTAHALYKYCTVPHVYSCCALLCCAVMHHTSAYSTVHQCCCHALEAAIWTGTPARILSAHFPGSLGMILRLPFLSHVLVASSALAASSVNCFLFHQHHTQPLRFLDFWTSGLLDFFASPISLPKPSPIPPPCLNVRF